jgi:hypothetical protein
MGTFPIRYLVAKPQKGHTLYYWQPSRILQQFGFLTRRLAERTNRLEDAIFEAERLNRELDRWRQGLAEPVIETGTLPWLVKLYRSTELYGDLAPKTQRSYEQGITLLEAWSKERGHPPITGLQTRHVRELLGTIERPAMRHLAYRTLRLLLSFAVAEGHLERNPARGLRIKGSRPRDVYWTAEQVESFIRAAEASERQSLGLAVCLGVNLGQREGDVLRLAWSQYEAGTFTLRQRKTGQLLSIPATAELRETLAAVSRRSPTIVIAETTGQPYLEDHFRHEFARIRDLAALPRSLRFMDLRRTAVVRLAEARCSVPEIAAVTGHTIDRTARILEVYLPRTAPMARAAVARLDEARRRTKSDSKLEG